MRLMETGRGRLEITTSAQGHSRSPRRAHPQLFYVGADPAEPAVAGRMTARRRITLRSTRA